LQNSAGIRLNKTNCQWWSLETRSRRSIFASLGLEGFRSRLGLDGYRPSGVSTHWLLWL